MKADDIQQMGRIISVLQVCIEKLNTISEHSGNGTPSAQAADNAAEWVGYALDTICETMSYEPSEEFR